jgi:hypothetical protein
VTGRHARAVSVAKIKATMDKNATAARNVTRMIFPVWLNFSPIGRLKAVGMTVEEEVVDRNA